MSIELKVPDIGESVEEVTIDSWLKKEGDRVEEDESVAVLETDKVTVELPAPQAGVIESIKRRSGESVQIGEVIGTIGESDGKPAAEKHETEKEGDGPGRREHDGAGDTPQTAKKEAARAEPAEEEPSSEGAAEDGPAPDAEGERQREPGGKEQQGGRSERVKREDEPRRKEGKPEPAASGAVSAERGERVVPMSPIRRKIGRRLVEAQRNAALLTTFNKVDMSAVGRLRREYGEAFEARHQVRLGIMSFFVRAACEALKRIPELNAEIRGDNIVYKDYCDIGVAVATDKGLVVPVIRDAERLSLARIETVIRDFARRAREGKLEVQELEGGTFTISNGGVFGSTLSTPIVNPPQSGVLGLHAIEEQPVVRDGEIVVRPIMNLALGYDHRIVDGREAVTFLKSIRDAVEDPARLLLGV